MDRSSPLALAALVLALGLIAAPPDARADSSSVKDGCGPPSKFAAFLETLLRPAILNGPPESVAMQRAGIALEGGGDHARELDASGQKVRIVPAATGQSGSRGFYDGVEYLEFPNSTILQTTDPHTGKARSFLLSRGVRRYETEVDLSTGKINPQGYVSDVLVFELVKGKAVYRSRLLKSAPETHFLFEDPRISVLYFPDGTSKILLSGTDYSPHVSGSTSPDVMNRYLEIGLDSHGAPLPPEVDALGVPKFSNLSPRPRLRPGKGLLAVDAKNGTIAFNEAGQIVVRTRLRPDFADPDIQALAGGDRWNYAEQVFVFKDYDEFRNYDWDHCLEDLFGKTGDTARVRPVLAEVLLRDTQVHDLKQDPRAVPGKGRAASPGTSPVRVVRRGDDIFISNGKNAPDLFAGKVPPGLSMKDGEVTYLTWDHELGAFGDVRGDHSFAKRDYDLTVKKFDASLTRIEAYYSGAIQPRTPHELGYNSGIADLQHVYPMGREVIMGADGRARVRVSMGVSDAHTEMLDVDVVALLLEMEPGGARWNAGQVYCP